MRRRSRTIWTLPGIPSLVVAALVLVFAGTGLTFAQEPSPDEHAAHHGGPTTNASPSGKPTDNQSMSSSKTGDMTGMQSGGASQGSAAGGKAGMGDMGRMMEGMGGSRQKEIVPALMDVPRLTTDQRVALERRARDRMQTSLARLSGAVVRLSEDAAKSSADDKADYDALHAVAVQAREALSEFETGVAARRALAEGQEPRRVALRWFQRDLNLLSPQSEEESPSWLGLPPFHLLALIILSTFVAVMVGMYVLKMRRASALLTRLAAPAAPEGKSSVPMASAGLHTVPVTASSATPILSLPSPRSWSGKIRVARIFTETNDVKTFRLALPKGDDVLPFTFEPGQFLTVGVPVDGKAVKRSYSIASSPCCQGWCEITVKQAPHGVVSGYLHEQVREGDLLDVSAAYGRFTFRGTEAKDVVFIAGGVGITPLMSAIRYLTDQSWPGEIFLVYACARRSDIIFCEELNYLQHRHPNLHVTVVLSKEESPDWAGPRGHITAELLKSAVPDTAARRVHLCGPPAMMESVKAALIELGVPSAQIQTEAFLGPEPRRTEADMPDTAYGNGTAALAAVPPTGQTALCTFVRSAKATPLPPDRTILEASEAVGVNIEYSCRQGYCGVCKIRLLAGQVTMEVEDALTPEDKAGSIILACQAKSTSNVSVDA